RESDSPGQLAPFSSMAAQANRGPLGPALIPPDPHDPSTSPWRPTKALSEGVAKPAAAPPAAVEVLDVKSLPAAAKEAEGPVDFNTCVAALEKKLIESALAHCRGHQKKAAERLGLSYHQMRGLLRKYGYGRDTAEDAARAADATGSSK